MSVVEKERAGSLRMQRLVLPAIVLLAALFRFSHLNWDGLQLTHPDERYILFVANSLDWPQCASDLLRPLHSTLNPFRELTDGGLSEARSYPYGHLPLYTMLVLHSLVSNFLDAAFPDALNQFAIVGRVLSAFYDTTLVFVVGLLAKELFNRWAAWVAAGMTTLAVLHIQQAHFAAVDSALALYATLALLQAIKHPPRRASLLAGLFSGLALGSKASGALLIVPLLVAHVRRAAQSDGLCGGEGETIARHNKCDALLSTNTLILAGPRRDSPTGMLRKPACLPWAHTQVRPYLVFALLTMALAFALTNPYAVLQPGLFLRDVGTQAALLRGRLDWTFTRQYTGTLPIWYFVQQQARWGLGLPLTIAAYGGLGWATAVTWRRERRELWPLLSWAWLNLIIVGTQFVKFPRYLLPLTPVLFVLAAGMLSRLRRSGTPIAFMVLLATGLNALAFINLYDQPHPWQAASRWIYDNLPTGTVLIVERWDDALPLDIDGKRAAQVYEQKQVDSIEEPANEAKLEEMLEEVAASDYIVLSSNRLYGMLGFLDERYLFSAAYYRHLFAENLGFTLERAFTRYPNLFGIAIVDDTFTRSGFATPSGLDDHLPHRRWQRAYADESFTVYDHPLVLIFRNDAHLSASDMQKIILSDL